jgi:phospholipid/cholesterol/gamma-HCH transport system substrate-binding protein
MKHNAIETIMGAVVLVIAGFFIVFAYRTSGFDDDHKVAYYANFDRIDGLVVGADVRISGIKVGIIKTTEVDPKTYLAKVVFTVDPQIKLPKDSSAEIASEGLLGGKFIAIVPGGDTAFIQPGGIINYTQSSVNLESLIGQLIFSSKKEGEDKKSETKQPNK